MDRLSPANPIGSLLQIAVPRPSGAARRAAWTAGLRSTAWVMIGLWGIFGLAGCGGCTSSQAKIDREAKRKQLEEEEKKKKEKEKPKPDFADGALLTQPNSATPESYFKPGHWTSGTVEMIANNFDFHGELTTDPFDLDGMPYRLGTSRQAQLPKGQKKVIELVFYLPPGKLNNKLFARLQTAGGRREMFQDSFPVNTIPEHQFYLVVLSTTPDRYRYLKILNSVQPPMGFNDSSLNAYYRVAMPKVDKRVPLASNPLCWTAVAYLLWDDLDPSLLTPEQQLALIDWLHWGGRLIVNGPDSLDPLRGSFLSPYLPATGGEALPITPALLSEVNRHWTQADQPLTPGDKPWSGRKLLVDPADADVQILLQSAENEPLLVERRVGRGSVVLSAFGLSQRQLRNWDGLDEFVNACLLRRPSRSFLHNEEDGIYSLWPESRTPMFDPEQISNLRYFTRDDSIKPNNAAWNILLSGGIPPRPEPVSAEPAEIDKTQMAFWPRNLKSTADTDKPKEHGAGVAGWEDFNLPGELARQSLRQAAHIAIPDANFVAVLLGVYLAVLVPLNWMVFRLFGRVELAWVAAPAITVSFALAVVKLAQLDIGFARAKTELAVVELHGLYPRAHVTRYTALYTSLSTRYDFSFNDTSALVQPFPPFSRDEGRDLLSGQPRSTVNFRRVPSGESESGTRITLEGFEVSSNSLGMLHSEHMSELGGIQLKGSRAGGWSVVNQTDHELRGVGVVGDDEVAWVGRLRAGAEVALKFEPGSVKDLWNLERASEWQPGRDARDHVDLQRLARLAEAATPRGELRLVGWTDEEIPGMSIQPGASQSHSAALFVAHLTHGIRPPPRRDQRSFLAALADQQASDRSQGIDPRPFPARTLPGDSEDADDVDSGAALDDDPGDAAP